MDPGVAEIIQLNNDKVDNVNAPKPDLLDFLKKYFLYSFYFLPHNKVLV